MLVLKGRVTKAIGVNNALKMSEIAVLVASLLRLTLGSSNHTNLPLAFSKHNEFEYTVHIKINLVSLHLNQEGVSSHFLVE